MNECVVCKGPSSKPFCAAACMARANRDADAAEAAERRGQRVPCPACGDRGVRGFGCPEPRVHLWPERYAEVAEARRQKPDADRQAEMRTPPYVCPDCRGPAFFTADGERMYCRTCTSDDASDGAS